MNNLNNKHILIVGASEGIGKATAMECAKRGACLSLIARSNKVKEVVTKLGDSHSHVGLCFDVGNIENINQMVCEIVDKNGPFDGIVYCVGPQCVKPLKVLKPQVVRETMGLGFGAYIELLRVASQKRNYRRPMSVVSISSIASQIGNPGKTIYSAMKAAMDAAVRSLAVELASKGIRVNSVCPGMVASKRLDELQMLVGSEGKLKEIEERQYLGVSDASDIAKTICFLLSEDAKVITGTNMDVSGGFLSS